MFQGGVGLIAGVIIGFIYQWNMGLVILGLLPATALWSYYQFVAQTAPPPKASKYSDFERTMISDSVSNYSTMLTLAYQEEYVEKYYDWGKIKNKNTNTNFKQSIWNAHWFSIAYAVSNALINGYSIPLLYVLASNIEDGEDIAAQYIWFTAGVYSSLSLSIAMFNAPDFYKGKETATKIFKLIDNSKEGQHDSSIPDGSRVISLEEASGDIEFHGVWFKYPSTFDYVLKNFSFKIRSKESIGIVGKSGWGKSTVALLLLRFYEPDKGFITIGGTKITEFSIKSLRSVFGLVQQEPIIFNCSVMENIWYGKPHATAQEIRMAAELTNISTFINNLDVIENDGSS